MSIDINYISSRDNSEKYYCDEPGCGKSYSQKFRLGVHKRIHVIDNNVDRRKTI
jgi:hypothetical protein